MKDTFCLDDKVIPIFLPSHLIRWLENDGLDRLELLDGTGLKPQDIDSAEVLISFRQHRQLIGNAHRLSGQPHLGLLFGLSLEYTVMGVVGYAAMTSKDLKEGLETVIKYIKLRAPLIRLYMVMDKELARVSIDLAIDYVPLRTFLYEALLGATCRIFELFELVGEKTPQTFYACLSIPEPEDWSQYEHLIVFPVKFSQPVNEFVFSAAYLALKSKHADADTSRTTKETLEQQLQKLGDKEGLISRIKNIVSTSNPSYPSLVEIASILCVSPRTLRRELAKLDTTYQEILDEYRERISIQLLKSTNLTVQEIAVKMGYNDPANFGRAFRKWTGKSPGYFRN